jgi:hypothetical protein
VAELVEECLGTAADLVEECLGTAAALDQEWVEAFVEE